MRWCQIKICILNLEKNAWKPVEKKFAEKKQVSAKALCLGVESTADDFSVGIATFQRWHIS
jgi:hypothetical protein